MSSFWKDRPVLVTGAGGFIGSHLTERLLLEGAKVTAMLHYDTRADWSNLEHLPQELLSKLKIASGDICDPFYVRETVKGHDTVFHLAALIAIPFSYVGPQSYLRTNVEGTLNVLEAARRENIRRLVHTSTSETYGTAEFTPIHEGHPLKGQSPYSASKIGADKFAESYFRSFELPVVVLRPFNTYGPRQSARAIIPTIASQVLAGSETLKLGDLSPIRDFNFVADTVSAFLKVAEHDACIGQTLNCGSGKAVSVGEVAKMLMSIIGKEVKIISDTERIRPSKSEVFELLADAQKINKLTGWKPEHDLSTGLKLTVDFIAKNLNRYKPERYAI